MQDGKDHESDAMQQREPVMQQRSGGMEPLTAQTTADSLTRDETLPLRTMREEMAGMMAKRGRGTRGSDTATPRARIRAWLTEMRTGLAALLGVPPPEEL